MTAARTRTPAGPVTLPGRARERLHAPPGLDVPFHAGNQAVLDLVDGVLAAGGRPLAEGHRPGLEAQFGADFADVRVHTGPEAERSAAALGARAYAYGRHVVLGPGALGPESASGQALLRHELAHVVQQDAGLRAGAGPAPRQATEAEAATAEHAGAGSVAVSVASAPGLALAEEREQGWWDRQVEAAVAWASNKHHELQQEGLGYVRRAIKDWPAERFAVADQVLNVIELIDDICFGIVMFIAGANLGVIEGIFDLVVGFFVALGTLIRYMLAWLLQPLDNSRYFNEMCQKLIASIKDLPDGMRKSFRSWQDELRAASPDKKGFMLGRAFGQLVVMLLAAVEGAGLIGGAAAAAGEAGALAPAFAFAGVHGAEAMAMGGAVLGPAGAVTGALAAPAMQMSGKETIEGAGKGTKAPEKPATPPEPVPESTGTGPKHVSVGEGTPKELPTAGQVGKAIDKIGGKLPKGGDPDMAKEIARQQQAGKKVVTGLEADVQASKKALKAKGVKGKTPTQFGGLVDAETFAKWKKNPPTPGAMVDQRMKNMLADHPELADMTVDEFLTVTNDMGDLRSVLSKEQLESKLGNLRPDLVTGAGPSEPAVGIFDPTRGGPKSPLYGEAKTAEAMSTIPPDVEAVLMQHTAKNLLYAQVVAFVRSNTLIQMGETYWNWVRKAPKPKAPK